MSIKDPSRELERMVGADGMRLFNNALKRIALMASATRTTFDKTEKKRLLDMLDSDDEDSVEVASVLIIDNIKQQKIDGTWKGTDADCDPEKGEWEAHLQTKLG